MKRHRGWRARLSVWSLAAACIVVPVHAQQAVVEAHAAPPGWALQRPLEGRIRYEGVLNLDSAGLGAGAFLYPAPGLIGLVAAIATHSVINASSRSAQKNQLQEEADAVLKPYLGVLERLSDDALAQDALARAQGVGGGLWATAEPLADTVWNVEGQPVFRMTQDQTALVLDHPLRIRSRAATPTTVFEGTVRVVSTPLSVEAPQEHWLADDGRTLRETLALLYARSLEIALKRAAAPTPGAAGNARTVRYDEGRNARVERAKVIEAGCDRWLVENLRGWLLSVPVRRADDAPCPEAAPQPR